jgi:hypothetical protein
MYLPCFVFPYQREPSLWYTPVSVFTQTIPEVFAGGVCGFAGLGAAAGVAVACGLSELLDCGDSACNAETFTTATVATGAQATSSANDSFLALRIIVLLLTGFCVSLKCAPAGAQACWNSGMMAKKRSEVNTEKGQIRWPIGHWNLVSSERFPKPVFGSQSPTTTLRTVSTDSASPRRTGPSTNAGTSRSGASERLVARRGNSVR